MKENATEITERVEAKEKDFADLYKRMDEDFDRWKLTGTPTQADYQSTIKPVAKTYETDVKIVSNDLRTYSDKVQAILSDAEMQIMVRMAETEGEDKREDIGKLERLFYFALEQGDLKLRRLILPPLREQLIWYSLIRGWVAGRFLVYKKKGGVIFNFLPLDPRWVTYEVGGDGFLWVSYKTFRSKATLKDEYKYEAQDKDNNPVIDYWKYEKEGKIGNAVICDNKFLKKYETLDLPSMPILIMPVATRPPIAGSSMSELGGYGESIYASVRGIHDVRDQFASIVATHANLLAKQPVINYRDAEGIVLKDTIYFAESVLNLPVGHNKLEEAPTKEISPTVIQILNWLSEQEERATLPNIPIGAPPPSGTLYNLVQEAGNRVFNPQLKNLSYFYADICHLIEEQMIAGGIGVKVQQEEKRKYYETKVNPVDLKKPHMIKVEFTARTPWTQMDTAQVASMLKQLGLPDGWIWENILKVQDPKGLADLAAIELFEHSPKGAMKRAIEALIETRGDIAAAQSLIRDMDRLEAQEQMATEPPPEGAGA